ncbi:MAG TPA: hypothetical protein VMV92_30785 [Streptosporangiaceae bacterium]|nr:hypothetical protein [Streptosporangiaceae bacterium]
MKQTAGSWPAGEFVAHRGLIAFSATATMAEAALLCWLAPPGRFLAGQVTALPPLAVFHDLRWLYGYERSWFGFALLLIALIVTRSALNTAMARLAWPRGLPAPGLREIFRSAVTLTMAACVLLSPAATLTLGAAILPFSWPFLASLPVLLLISLPLSHGGILGSWWRTLPPPRALCWLLTDFVVLSLTAAAIGRLPVAVAVPVSGLAGVANARAWLGLTAAVARRPALRPAPPRPTLSVPLAPVAAVLSVAAVIGMTRFAFVVGRGPRQVAEAVAALQPGAAVSAGTPETDSAGPGTVPPGRYTRDPVLLIRGFGSACCASARSLRPIAPGAFVQQFSYRGMTSGGQPLPHGSAASDLPLPQLGDRIAAQVLRLHRETGRPVDIVAESEGTLGVDAMLATRPGLPLGSVVMMSPIVAPGRVSYPHGTGAGLMPADELRAMVWFVGGLSPFGSSGAQTLISSVNAVGARFAATAARHHPLRWMLLVPLADAVTLPVCPLPPDVYVVPELHGDLLGTPAVERMVARFLTDGEVREPGRYKATAEIVAAAAAAWRMPETTAPTPACGK